MSVSSPILITVSVPSVPVANYRSEAAKAIGEMDFRMTHPLVVRLALRRLKSFLLAFSFC